jgi:hypothetical protein
MSLTLIDYYQTEFPHQWNKHVLVTGHGGTRTDFLTRWLSMIPEYFNSWPSRWIIDVETGATLNNAINWFNFGISKLTPLRPRIVDHIQQQHNPHAHKKSVSKCHHGLRDLGELIPVELQDRFHILQILYDPNDVDAVSKIIWEFVIKTFTNQANDATTDERISQSWKALYLSLPPEHPLYIPEREISIVSDLDRCQCIQEIMAALIVGCQDTTYTVMPEGCRFDYTPIDYRLLIEPGNSQTIADLVGITALPYQHDMFDRAVGLAHTSTTHRLFGREWTLEEVQTLVKNYRVSLGL